MKSRVVAGRPNPSGDPPLPTCTRPVVSRFVSAGGCSGRGGRARPRVHHAAAASVRERAAWLSMTSRSPCSARAPARSAACIRNWRSAPPIFIVSASRGRRRRGSASPALSIRHGDRGRGHRDGGGRTPLARSDLVCFRAGTRSRHRDFEISNSLGHRVPRDFHSREVLHLRWRLACYAVGWDRAVTTVGVFAVRAAVLGNGDGHELDL